jgi:DNA-binding CsgD family transcriptional regulator
VTSILNLPPVPAALHRVPALGGLRVLSDIATAGSTSRGWPELRGRALNSLGSALPFAFGFFVGRPSPGAQITALGVSPAQMRLLTRHARSTWRELLELQQRAERGVLAVPVDEEEVPLLRLLRLDRPVTGLCLGWIGEEGTALVLAREDGSPFLLPELELFRLALPVLALAEMNAGNLEDSLGSPLTGREREIFEYLQRGYSNRQIALVLGTSPLTVRNQLGRLFRKVGVASRSELVGLATAPWARAGRTG